MFSWCIPQIFWILGYSKEQFLFKKILIRFLHVINGRDIISIVGVGLSSQTTSTLIPLCSVARWPRGRKNSEENWPHRISSFTASMLLFVITCASAKLRIKLLCYFNLSSSVFLPTLYDQNHFMTFNFRIKIKTKRLFCTFYPNRNWKLLFHYW